MMPAGSGTAKPSKLATPGSAGVSKGMCIIAFFSMLFNGITQGKEQLVVYVKI